jgi:hypothetical protein
MSDIEHRRYKLKGGRMPIAGDYRSVRLIGCLPQTTGSEVAF